MKFIKALIRFFMGLGVFLVALALFIFPLGTAYDLLVTKVIPEIQAIEWMPQDDLVRYTIAGAVLLLTVIAFWPSFSMRARRRVLTFPGAHGDVIIELDSLEKGLAQSVKALPEVKHIEEICVIPVNGGPRIKVTGEVVLKQVGASSAREAGNRISDFIALSASAILGVQGMVTVDLKVSMQVDPKALADALLKPQHDRKLLPEQSVVPQTAYYQPQQPVHQPVQQPRQEPAYPSYSQNPAHEASRMPGQPIESLHQDDPADEREWVDPSEIEPVDDSEPDSEPRRTEQ